MWLCWLFTCMERSPVRLSDTTPERWLFVERASDQALAGIVLEHLGRQAVLLQEAPEFHDANERCFMEMATGR
jgi:hypothetical protein